MTKLLLPLALLAAVSPLFGERASAQTQYRPSRPTLSPYLNLADGQSNPAVTYYGIVRPQLAMRDALQRLQEDVTLNTQALASPRSVGDLGPTGNRARFMTHTRMFLNSGGNPYRAGTAITPAAGPLPAARPAAYRGE
jgi:hypothetical protein